MKKNILLMALFIIFISNIMSQVRWGSGDGLVLMKPVHNEEINTTTITFEWAYHGDEKDVNYQMLLGEKEGENPLVKQEIDPYSNKFTKSGFLRGKQYWWRIICRNDNSNITWVDGYFTISQNNVINNSATKPCPYCNSTGKKLIPESYRTCTVCNGTGKIKWRTGFYHKCEPPIGACYGTGKIKVPTHYESCSYCDGTGKMN